MINQVIRNLMIFKIHPFDQNSIVPPQSTSIMTKLIFAIQMFHTFL